VRISWLVPLSVAGLWGAPLGYAAEKPMVQPPRQIAVTIDDLPLAPGNRPTTEQAVRTMDKLLSVLESRSVPAIGFVNELKLEMPRESDDNRSPREYAPARLALLETWLQRGFALGNHGYRHLDLHRVDVNVWEQDILDGERILRPLLKKYGQTDLFFRHPFLHTGREIAIRDHTLEFLDGHGYRVAPVTIDNQEWIFGFAYHEATPSERNRIGRAYVDYMKSMVVFYEEQTMAIVGEPIPHILLVHVYALNADWLGELLDWLRERGYQFVSLSEALEHPVYQREDRYDGPGGITWLHRWAITDGMPRSTFDGEPEVPDWLPTP